MKNVFFATIVICLFLVSCGSSKKESADLVKIETSETALDYNNEMMDLQNKVDDAYTKLLDVFLDSEDINEIEASKAETIEIIKNVRKDVEDMRDFDGKDDYKKAMIDLLNMYEDNIKNNLTGIINMTFYSEEMSDDQWAEGEELYDSMYSKYDKAFVDFKVFYDAFSEKWDI